jgi:2-polyprenyl-3-methyl-5-hydroxy-6-metoxy-1,4-benzoquinol methylase
LDPAEIMRDIRRRVVEQVRRKRTEEIASEIDDKRVEDIKSALEDMSRLGTGSPWQARYLGSKYQFPLKPLALKVRRIVQAEIRWTLESFIEEQRRLNFSTASVLRTIWEQVREFRSITASLQEHARRSSTDLSRLGHRYVAFEEVARGSSSLVRSRQAFFLEHFRGRRNVLDIGCGRGEFLQLLKEIGVESYGIDKDPEMVKVSRSYGLNAIEADALDHLRALQDRTLGGVFCSQVIEHMNSAEALEFIELAYEKLLPGSKIVIETVNPTSVFALSEFYRDITHVKPIHPLTLKFLMDCVGFTSVEVQFLNQPGENQRLDPISGPGADIERINRNFQKLNALLWGPMDYAAIGIR